MELILIAAVGRNRVIGVDNQLPWHLPEDLKHFRELTRGSAVLMGRKTWDSLPAAFRPLPGRRNIVLSRQTTSVAGAEVFASLDQALSCLTQEAKVFVIGGADIYRQAIDRAQTLEITEVDVSPEGDAYFPEIDLGTWASVAEQPGQSAAGQAYVFKTYHRRMPSAKGIAA